MRWSVADRHYPSKLVNFRSASTLHIPALTILGAVIAVLQVIAVIVLRAHWTMDVLCGLFAALTIGLLVL